MYNKQLNTSLRLLPDFDLSIVMPFYRRLDEFKRVFPDKAHYYQRNGIEVIIVADEPSEEGGILEYIMQYPLINWKVVINDRDHLWRNPAKAFNVGIRQATKRYVMIMDPELEFYTDVIFLLREQLDHYPRHFAVGQVLFMDLREPVTEESIRRHYHEIIPYGSIMAEKECFETVGGFSEIYTEWGGEDDNLRMRLELAGIQRLFFPDALLIHREDYSLRTTSRNEQRSKIPRDALSGMLLPSKVYVNDADWGYDFNRIAFHWSENPHSGEQCRKYLSGLENSEISNNGIFNKTYGLIALIPAYNESGRIEECLRSVEKHCDGIIVLDDDSMDGTYEMVHSEKLLIKAKKCRVGFNDRENRNILMDLASFFRSGWYIFIDADERFDNRFMDLQEIMQKEDVDTVGVWIANLWDNRETYRTDMPDTHPLSQNGLWFRWRMFRNKGRAQIITLDKLHFNTVPNKSKVYASRTLLLHVGYLTENERRKKYELYQIEDDQKILDYESILSDNIEFGFIQNVEI